MDGVALPDAPRAWAWLDSARALAALAVVFSHVRDLMLADFPGGVGWAVFYGMSGFGHAGVVVFFVLSGFCIAKSVDRGMQREAFWPRCLSDRLTRLLPVLLGTILLGGTLDWLGAVAWELPAYRGTLGAHSLTFSVAERLGWAELLATLTFLQSLAAPAWGSNGPLWSLAFEFWFYLWFPALLMLRRGRVTGWLATFGLGLLFPQLWLGFACWLMGAGAFHFLRSGHKPEVNLRFALMAFVAALASIRIWPLPWLDLPLAVSFAFVALALARNEARLTAPPRWLSRFGATSSYSLYAIHFPIALMIAALVIGLARLDPNLANAVLSVLVTLTIAGIAWAFSLLTERQTPRLRAWIERRA